MYAPAKKLAYGVFLVALSLVTLLPSTFVSAQASSGTIQVDSLVAGPPPDTPPTVEEPNPKTTFSTKSIRISGSCISGLVVKVYRNNFFAGSALCQQNGMFSLWIDLFVGKNVIVTKQFDQAGQASPISNTIVVYYAPEGNAPSLPDSQTPDKNKTPTSEHPQQPTTEVPGETPSDTAQFQLIIEYDYTLQAIFANQPFQLPITFAGGTAPYAVNVDWGDKSNDVFSRDTTKPFSVDHTYTNTGYQTVKITVSDKEGKKASLQFVVLVSGEREHPVAFLLSFDKNTAWGYTAAAAAEIILLIGAFMAGKHFAKSPSPKKKK